MVVRFDQATADIASIVANAPSTISQFLFDKTHVDFALVTLEISPEPDENSVMTNRYNLQVQL